MWLLMSALIMPNIKPLIILQSTRLWTNFTELYYRPLKQLCIGDRYSLVSALQNCIYYHVLLKEMA